MTLLLDLALRSALLLAAGLAGAACLRRRSAALRHLVLAAALFMSALCVPLNLIGPSWEVPLPNRAWIAAPTAPAASRQTPASTAVAHPDDVLPDHRLPPEAVVLAIWLTGVVACAACVVTGLLRIARLTRRATPMRDPRWTAAARDIARALGLTRALALLRVDRPDVLATWGFLRPVVLLPRDAAGWSDARIRAVLAHELAHVGRHDWPVQIAAACVCALFWWNPLAWMVSRALRRESERAADDAVLGLGVGPREYAGHLVALARRHRRSARFPAAAMSMARSSTLEGRIAAMLNTQTDRSAVSRRTLATLVALTVAVGVPVGALRAGQIAPRPLTGTVFDATGALMPGVELTLEGADEVKAQTTTGSDGRFEFAVVAPGRYRLVSSIAGFASLREDISLARPQDWDRAITLQVGTLSEQIHVSASRAPAPQADARPGVPRRVRVGGNVKAPLKTQHVNPAYPESMRQAGREGEVPIEAIIGADGTVALARVRGAHVHPDFGAAALDAVRQWRFTPTLLNGEPVEVQMMVTVRFSLSD